MPDDLSLVVFSRYTTSPAMFEDRTGRIFPVFGPVDNTLIIGMDLVAQGGALSFQFQSDDFHGNAGYLRAAKYNTTPEDPTDEHVAMLLTTVVMNAFTELLFEKKDSSKDLVTRGTSTLVKSHRASCSLAQNSSAVAITGTEYSKLYHLIMRASKLRTSPVFLLRFAETCLKVDSLIYSRNIRSLEIFELAENSALEIVPTKRKHQL